MLRRKIKLIRMKNVDASLNSDNLKGGNGKLEWILDLAEFKE